MRPLIRALAPFAAQAAAVLAAVLGGVAAGVAGASFVVSLLVALTVLLLGGLQVLVIEHLRRVRRRLDRLLATPRPPLAAPATAATSASDVAGTRWVGGLPLPPQHLRFMTESDDRFVATGRALAAQLAAHGLRPDSHVLDVGCGYGRLAVGLLDAKFAGTYKGFDILPRHIAWCSNVITGLDRRYTFEVLDVRNDRYNPGGSVDPANAVFPAEDASTDLCSLFSVFTHLDRPTVVQYLREIHRVLRPGGTAVTSWLLFDDDRLAEVVSDASSYPLRLQGDDGSRFMLAEDPLRAIGFPTQDVVAMIGAAGLEVVNVELGYWSKGNAGAAPGREFQDLVILRRPPAA